MVILFDEISRNIRPLKDALLKRNQRDVNNWFYKYSKGTIVNIDDETFYKLKYAAEMGMDSLAHEAKNIIDQRR